MSDYHSAVVTYPARRVSGGPNICRMAETGSHDHLRKKRVGYVIRLAREARGLTQGELAERVSRVRSTINEWETGKSAPSLTDMPLIVAALALDPAAFIAMPDPPEPAPAPESPIAPYLREVTPGPALDRIAQARKRDASRRARLKGTAAG